MNCAHPVNWGNCWPPDWLMQGVHDYIRLRSQRPYSQERDILQSLEGVDGLGRLDDTKAHAGTRAGH